jgi:hypothetical protein
MPQANCAGSSENVDWDRDVEAGPEQRRCERGWRFVLGANEWTLGERIGSWP